VAVQSDGKILIGGGFTSVNRVACTNLARLYADGSLDTTFTTTLTGTILSMVLQPDGKILIGRWSSGVARLNPDGSVDTSFVPGAGGDVFALVLQPDGKILVGCVSYYSSDPGLIRLNSDGSIDSSFSAPLTGRGTVLTLALQPDGKILVGGTFEVTGVERRSLVRLNANGSLDGSFAPTLEPGSDSLPYVNALARQTDGRILVGGDFGYVNGQRKACLARLNPDASLDTTFPSHPSGPGYYVRALAAQADGKVLIGGHFRSVSGVEQAGLARLNGDGSLDNSFVVAIAKSGSPVWIESPVFQADGRILIGGWFYSVNGVARGGIARLHPDGSLDTTFQNGMSGLGSNYDGWGQAIALQPDGKVLVGGSFALVNGVARGSIARLHPDGSLDTSFQNGMSGLAGSTRDCWAILLQPDGRILIGGQFESVNGVTRNCIARLQANGSLDTTFQNGMSGLGPGSSENRCYALALQPDGKILVGGNFKSVNGVARTNIARLNANGSLDSSFRVILGPTGTQVSVVGAIVLQNDGKILVGGWNLRIEGVAPYVCARLSPDGSLDPSFVPVTATGVTYPLVTSIALQADGRILVGGRFSSLNGYVRNHVARLLAYDDLGITDCRCTNGLFAFNLTGPLGCQALVQASTDLQHWVTLHGCQLTNSPLGFVDPESSLYPKRFYRLMDAAGVALMEQERWAGGQFHLNLVGELGRTVVVEASSNLSDWTPIATNVLGSDPIPFADPDSEIFPHRFYRLLKP